MPRSEYVEVGYPVPLKLRESVYAPPVVFSMIEPASTLEGEHYHVVWRSPPVTVLATTKAASEALEGWKKIMSPKNLLIRSPLEVYLDRNEKMGNRLVYVKDRCQPAGRAFCAVSSLPVKPDIFLHLIPADKDDLPDYRKRYGFDSLDFHFNDYRIQLDERCIAIRHLPAYDVVGIRTGEYADEGTIWRAEVSFNE